METTIKEFLAFRQKFTKRQWAELNQAVEAQFNKKADQLELDDLDIQVILERLEGHL